MVMTRVVRRAGVPSALLVYSVERFGPVDAAPVLLIPCSCVVVHMLTFIDHIHRFLIIRRGVAPRGTRGSGRGAAVRRSRAREIVCVAHAARHGPHGDGHANAVTPTFAKALATFACSLIPRRSV